MSFGKMLKEVMGGSRESLRTAGQRHVGPRIGVVTNNVDPENRYRVKIKFPETDDTVESFWARVPSSSASGEGADSYGMFILPEVDDEVMVHFNDGDPEHCFVAGRLWNGVNNSPPAVTISPDDTDVEPPNNAQGGANDYRFWRSRMGHHILFNDKEGEGGVSLRSKKSNELYIDDKDGAEKIRLYDQNRTQWLEIDVPGKKITMETDEGDILIKAKETIRIECKNLEVEAYETIKVESGTSSEWKAGSTLKWESGSTSNYKAGATMTLQGGPKIELNP